MGATIRIDTEGRAENEALSDHSVMLALDEPLTALADGLGVARLSSFHDHSELLAEYADLLPDGAPEGAGAAWFAPDQVFGSVAAIRSHLQAKPDALKFNSTPSQQNWPQKLIAELTDCQEVLEQAVSAGKKVRLLIVP